MAGFKFEARDSRGRRQRGVLQADTARQARAALREQGLLPVAVEALSEGAVARRGFSWRRGLGAAELSMVTRQLATLLGAGLTVDQTLQALIEQAEGERVRQVFAGVRGEVLAGQTLARALGQYPAAFGELYQNVVKSGEQSGELPGVLLRLADYLEASHALRQKVGLAFVYPAIISVVALLVVVMLVSYVVPQVVGVFENTGQELPWLTRALIATSDFLRAAWPYLLGGAALAAWAATRALRRPRLRHRVHQAWLRLPVVGRLVRTANAARLASTLAILVGSGVPLLAALAAAGGVVHNLPLRQALDETLRRVREGASFSRALAHTKVFPPVLSHLIASGEASGKLGHMLERAATQQTQELQTRVATLTGLLEPLLILVMGALVLLIVLAILLPVMEMNQLVH